MGAGAQRFSPQGVTLQSVTLIKRHELGELVPMFQRIAGFLSYGQSLESMSQLLGRQLEQAFRFMGIPGTRIFIPIPTKPDDGDPLIRIAPSTHTDGPQIALRFRVIAIGYELAEQRQTTAEFMWPETRQTRFSILHPFLTLLLPVDARAIASLQIGIQMHPHRELLEKEMEIVDLKDGVVTLLRPVSIIGDPVGRRDRRSIPRPSIDEPVIAVAHRDIERSCSFFGRRYAEHRGEQTQTFETYQAFPGDGQAALAAILDESIGSQQVASDDGPGFDDRPPGIGGESQQLIIDSRRFIVLSAHDPQFIPLRYAMESAARRSSCSKADAMRSISAWVRPNRAASSRHVATARPTSAAMLRALPSSSSKYPTTLIASIREADPSSMSMAVVRTRGLMSVGTGLRS